MQRMTAAPLSRIMPFRASGFLAALKQMIDVTHSRRQLAALDARSLEDLGLSREDALSEANRAPWDVPGHWRC